MTEDVEHPTTLAANDAIKKLYRLKEEGKLITNLPLPPHPCENMSDDEDNSSEEVSSEVEDDEETFDVWSHLVRSAVRSKETIFECLNEQLQYYYHMVNSSTYEKIIGDIKNMLSQSPTMSFESTLDKSIKENKELIVRTVEDCRNDLEDHNAMNIWCAMADRHVQDGCQWFSGSECNCNECNGASLCNRFRIKALLFHGMEKDDVIGKIILQIKMMDGLEEDALEDEIKREIEKYRDIILETFNREKDELLYEFVDWQRHYVCPMKPWKLRSM